MSIIQERVELARRGENPTVICRVPSGWVVLGDDQALRGYCILLADPLVEDINHLAGMVRQQFLADMVRIGDVLIEITGAALINYQMLGNVDRNLHAHIHPRYAEEPDETRLLPPFSHGYVGAEKVPFDADRDRPLMEAIAQKLKE